MARSVPGNKKIERQHIADREFFIAAEAHPTIPNVGDRDILRLLFVPSPLLNSSVRTLHGGDSHTTFWNRRPSVLATDASVAGFRTSTWAPGRG